MAARWRSIRPAAPRNDETERGTGLHPVSSRLLLNGPWHAKLVVVNRSSPCVKISSVNVASQPAA